MQWNLKRKLVYPIIILFFVCSCIMLSIAAIGVDVGFENYFYELLANNINTVEKQLDAELENIKGNLHYVATSSRMTSYFEVPNQPAEMLKEMAKSFGASYVDIVNSKGNMTYASDGISRDFATLPIIKDALTGKADARITYFDGQLLFLGCAPSIAPDGKVRGVVVCAHEIGSSSYLDNYKELIQSEISLFIEDTRAATTIQNADGKRIIGTKLGNPDILETVYEKHQNYNGGSVIDGKKYVTVYAPFKLEDSSVRSMIYVGLPKTTIIAIRQSISGYMGITITVVGIFLVAIIILLIIRVVTGPVKRAKQAIHHLAEGDADLSFRLNFKANDELGDLCKDIDIFLSNQQELVRNLITTQQGLKKIGENLSSSSQQSASAISEIMANIQGVKYQTETQSNSLEKTNFVMDATSNEIGNLSRLIENQSAGIVESSAAIEEMVGNILAVTSSIQKMSNEFKSLTSVAVNGRDRQNDVDQRVKEMAEQSKLLMEANSVISSIASQTNLLAMNAAIEAAHAGEAGAGFSVVADEIRKLAENSSKQSKAIGLELKGISQSISEVVSSSLASKEAFLTVNEKIEQTDCLVQEINDAMEEQRIASQQVLEALKDINSSTDEVQSTAKKMENDAHTVTNEMIQLTQIAETVSCSMDEMSAGVSEINTSAQDVSEMARETNEQISVMTSFIGKFKV